jgi:hypothetical protein
MTVRAHAAAPGHDGGELNRLILQASSVANRIVTDCDTGTIDWSRFLHSYLQTLIVIDTELTSRADDTGADDAYMGFHTGSSNNEVSNINSHLVHVASLISAINTRVPVADVNGFDVPLVSTKDADGTITNVTSSSTGDINAIRAAANTVINDVDSA